MCEFRIVKRGETESYLVQKKVLGLFWYTWYGRLFDLTLEEARSARKCFETGCEMERAYKKALKAKNTVVE